MIEPESNRDANDEAGRESDLAELLRQLCEHENVNGDESDFEERLDRLSEEELGDLFGAGQCLHLLQQLRDHPDRVNEAGFETASQQKTTPDQLTSTQAAIPERIGNYDIIRLAAKGGFAYIYQAHDAQLNRDVALKVPLLERLDSPEAKERFQREARAVATLSHPAIVPVYDSGSSGDDLFIALQWIPGSNLHSFLKNSAEPISPRDAASAVERIADAVAHAHSKGILHRDIKPANLLLHEDELTDKRWFECLMITDFGLAKHFSESNSLETITVDGSILGTPAYMSPEQVRSDVDIGPAADVYSLGIVLYELLTGVTPHKKTSYSATIRAIEYEPPQPISKLRSGVPPDLTAICEKCLAKNPADRYSTAFELSADLERFRNGFPVKATRPTRLNQFYRWVKRNPVVAACLSITFLSLVGGMIATTLMWNRATESRDDLRTQVEILMAIFEDLDGDREGEVLDEPDLRERLADRLIASADLIAQSKDYEQRSSLLSTLGRTLSSIGHPNEANHVILQAIQLGDDRLSAELRMELQIGLAHTLMGQNKFNEAVDAITEYLPEILASDSIAHRVKADAISFKAETLFQLGEYDEAKSGFLLLQAWLPKLNLPKQIDLRISTIAEFRLAHIEYFKKPGKKTIEPLLSAYRKIQNSYSLDHRHAISAAYGVVVALRSRRRFDEALEIAESILKISKKKYGLNDRSTLMAMDSVMSTCGQISNSSKFRKRMIEIAPVAEASCEAIIEDLGESHPDIIVIYGNVSLAYGIAGDLEKCIAIKRHLIQLAESDHGRQSALTQNQVVGLGVALVAQGENEEAIELLKEFISVADSGVNLDAKVVRSAKQQLLIAQAAQLINGFRKKAEEEFDSLAEQERQSDSSK